MNHLSSPILETIFTFIILNDTVKIRFVHLLPTLKLQVIIENSLGVGYGASMVQSTPMDTQTSFSECLGWSPASTSNAAFYIQWSRWWLKHLCPYHPHGRPKCSSDNWLVKVQAVAGIWGVSHSLPPSSDHSLSHIHVCLYGFMSLSITLPFK